MKKDTRKLKNKKSSKTRHQFKKGKHNKKEETSLQNEKSLFKLIFIYSKKGKSV